MIYKGKSMRFIAEVQKNFYIPSNMIIVAKQTKKHCYIVVEILTTFWECTFMICMNLPHI